MTFNNLSNKRGVIRSRVELTAVPENSVLTMRAKSERGPHCRLRVNPGPLTVGSAG